MLGETAIQDRCQRKWSEPAALPTKAFLEGKIQPGATRPRGATETHRLWQKSAGFLGIAPGGIDARICQDTRSGGLDDLLASAEIGHDALVDLASAETFQAPDDLSLGSAVRRAACDVINGRLMVPHADDDGSIEGGVGVAVALSGPRQRNSLSYLEFQGWETRIDPIFEPRNNAGFRNRHTAYRADRSVGVGSRERRRGCGDRQSRQLRPARFTIRAALYRRRQSHTPESTNPAHVCADSDTGPRRNPAHIRRVLARLRLRSSGSRPCARRRWWGGFSRSHNPLPKRWRDGGHAATPTA